MRVIAPYTCPIVKMHSGCSAVDQVRNELRSVDMFDAVYIDAVQVLESQGLKAFRQHQVQGPQEVSASVGCMSLELLVIEFCPATLYIYIYIHMIKCLVVIILRL